MTGLAWKLNRLRTMGAREIAYRMRHAVQARWERWGLGLARPGFQGETCGRAWLPELQRDFDVIMYRAAADRVLAGRFDVFALKDAALGFPPQWNRDPKTGTMAPLLFGKTLNYRDEKIVGDIKYLWEPNRHAELVTLAQAWHLTGEEKYVEGCRILLESWFDQCPYPLGVNWTSSLELAIRLLNWAWVWQLLGGADCELVCNNSETPFKQRWLAAIYQHCHFISGHFSYYSSANNHLFGEYMGLFVGATCWPYWKESAVWQDKGRAGLEQEAIRQNYPDGCNREQGIWYHHEVADMMLLCGLVGRANNIGFSDTYWNRLELMLEFIASMMDTAGNMPMIGDSDDAVIIRFVPDQTFPVFQSLLATGTILFERPDFAAKARAFDDKSRWLLGDDGVKRFADLLGKTDAEPLTFRREFPDGGYYILGHELETEREVKLIVDAGPLGYLSIAAHGHADALAMTLSIGGCALLIDPGTYAYHTERKWRDYFKGTSAHNTVRIDGLDQSVSGGNFLWLKHANAWCDSFAVGTEQDTFTGTHDGYMRLKDPVRHSRRITLSKVENTIEILDAIDCKASHHIELFWHFAETCVVAISGSAVLVEQDEVRLTMTMPESDWEPQLYMGDELLPLGWVSRRFDVKTPSPTVVWRGDISGCQQYMTVFYYQFKE